MELVKKYHLSEILQRLLATRSNTRGQPVTFHAFDLENVLSILESGVAFNHTIPDIDRHEILLKAAFTIAAASSPDVDTFEKALLAAEKEYLRRRAQRFILATSIGVRPLRELRRAAINGAYLTFTAGLPSRFDRSSVKADIDRVAKNAPTGLTTVRVTVEARTPMAGYELALRRLDELRGWWNFTLNSGVGSRRSSGRTRPINAILMGPVQTLHLGTGALARDMFWYEDRPLERSWVYDMGRSLGPVKDWTAHVRRRLKHIRYGWELDQLVVRYVRAGDMCEYDVAFNKLWGVLEHLVGAVGAYDKLIRRVLFLYHEDDQRFQRLVLEHLRDVRNGIVHLDHQRYAMEKYLYQLKEGVERAMVFHLRQGQSFETIAAAAELLDLPSSRSALQRELARLRHALRLRS